MPTLFSHPIVPLSIGLLLGRQAVSPGLLLAGMLASILPDADVLAFKLGIAYAHAFGHRGFSHSLLFAAVLALALLPLFWRARSPRRRGWNYLFLFLCAASHPLLDALTNGGLGVALAWPWSEQRWFAPWRPIEVSPLGWRQLWSMRFAEVLASELRYLWLPGLLLGLAGWALRRRA